MNHSTQMLVKGSDLVIKCSQGICRRTGPKNPGAARLWRAMEALYAWDATIIWL